MAKWLLGEPVCEAMNAETAQRVTELRARGVRPGLAIVRCGLKAEDLAYEQAVMRLAEKLGIGVQRYVLPEGVKKNSLLKIMDQTNANAEVQGVLLLRPLPVGLRGDEEEIVNALEVERDVDGMTERSLMGVFTGKSLGFPPCTAEACLRLLDFYGIGLEGKRVTVIGRSLVVGRPLAMMMMERGATVTICHRQTRDLAAVTREAEVIVTAAGALGLLTGEMVRPGQVVVDVAMNRNAQGEMAGDARFEEVEKVVGAITPVPGGVGAVTTSVLMRHVVEAGERGDDR